MMVLCLAPAMLSGVPYLNEMTILLDFTDASLVIPSLCVFAGGKYCDFLGSSSIFYVLVNSLKHIRKKFLLK